MYPQHHRNNRQVHFEASDIFSCLAQDKKDDLALGLGSASIVMGDNTKYWLTGFGAAMVSGLVLVGVMAEQTVAYYLAVALTAAHVGHQVRGHCSSNTLF